MIKQIIHIADLHIRAGDTSKSRFSEYEVVMNRIVEDLSTYKPILKKNAIIVIAGDIFHHKLKIESPGLKLSLYFIGALAKLAEVFIIRGNHDYKQAYPDEPDLIESLLSIDIPNVTYLNKSGHYKVHNIGFGLVSIQDALFSGNTQGIAENLPEFPNPTYFDNDPDIQHKIALFHGPVTKTRLPNGMEIMESHSYPLEWFKGYDSIMLGDIHLQQVNNSKIIDIVPCKFKHSIMINNHSLTNKLSWAYPGSTLQQDFGETLLGHGFLIWDLPTRNIQCYHTFNDYGYVTIKKHENEWLIHMKTQIDNKWIPIQQVINEPWFPKNVYLRIKTYSKSHDFSITNEIYSLFQKDNINIIEIRQDYVIENKSNNINVNSSNENIDLASFNTPNVWIEYLQDKISYNSTNDWKSWLINKDLLKLPQPEDSNMNKAIIEKINDKNCKFNKTLDDYHTDNESQHNLFVTKKPFTINYIQWDYILCYRNNNYFNFDNLESNINSITAKNAQGKTSFLETICVALFGEGFPSRNSKIYSASIICQEKPVSAEAKTIIHITINNVKYVITRVFSTQSNDSNKIHCQSNYTTLNMIENESIINIHTGKTAVNTWIETYIGSIQSFLLSCMISQNADMDFFGLKSTDQKELLDNALCINTSTQFHILLKGAKLHHIAIIEIIKTYLMSFSSNINLENCPQKIQDINTALNENTSRKNLILSSREQFSNKIRDTKLNNTELFKLGKTKISKKISELEKELASYEAEPNNFNIENLMFEIGALNNSLNNIGLCDKIKDYKRDDILIKKNNINVNDIELNIETSLKLINKYQFELNEMFKIQPFKSIIFTTIDDFENSKKKLENKYSTYSNLLSSLEELQKHSVDKPKEELKCINRTFELSSNDTLSYLLNDITDDIKTSSENLRDLIQQLENYKIEFNDVIKSQPIQPKNTHDEYLQWKNTFESIKDNYPNDQQYIEDQIKLLKLTIETCNNKYLHSLHNKPVISNENYKQLVKQYNRLSSVVGDSKLPTDIQTINNMISKISEYNTIIVNTQNRIKEHQLILNSLDDHPYNPECWACQKQPWKVHKETLVTTINYLNNTITQTQKKLKKFTTLENLQTHLENIQKLNDIENKKQSTYEYLVWKKTNDTLIVELESNKNSLKDIEEFYDIFKLYNYWEDDNKKYIEFKLWTEKISSIEQNINLINRNINDVNNKLENYNFTRIEIENDLLTISWDKYTDFNQKYTQVCNDKSKWDEIIASEDYWNWKKNITDIELNLTNEKTCYELYISQQQKFILYKNLCETWDIIDKINELQNTINNYKKANDLRIMLNDYQVSYDLWDDWYFIENNYKLIKDIENTIHTKHIELSLLQHEMDNSIKTESLLKYHQNYLKILESRLDVLTSIYNEFSDFTVWLYTDKVIPSLVNSVNNIIKDICDNRPIYIQCNVNKPITGSISFDWFLKDGLSAPPIEKASGFQKFIVGLAIRIALSTIGASGIKPTQLFIDEGFGALDVDNLSKVNDFLDTLLIKYKHIVIVSHLQDLNDCAKKHIFIKRNINETTSQLQFGEKINYDKLNKIKKISPEKPVNVPKVKNNDTEKPVNVPKVKNNDTEKPVKKKIIKKLL